MDTSKNYIKMCRQADEIRTNWKPKLGDYFFGVPQDFSDMEYEQGIYQFLICEDEFYNIIPDTYDPRTKQFNGIGDDDEAVYLPRLDELQQMIDFELPGDLINKFHKWYNELDNSMIERLKTMEQIWLSYVMMRNHSKQWTGRDWEHVSFDNFWAKLPSFPQKEEMIDEIFSHENIRIERICSSGQLSPKGFWYDQKENEWLILLTGGAEITLKEPEEIIRLKQGDYYFIPCPS